MFGPDGDAPAAPGWGYAAGPYQYPYQNGCPYPAQYQVQYPAQYPVVGYPYPGAPYPYGGPLQVQLPMTMNNPVMPQAPGPAPAADPSFRTCNMKNSTGGIGCEPGYNYVFPTEHTKIHVLKTGSTPPWHLPANFVVYFHACHVPVNTTLSELLKGFGARNALPGMNKVTEVVPDGVGRWYKGMELRGDDLTAINKPIKEFG